MYGHYRQKLNFTFKAYNKICKLLRSFREMVNNLKITEDTGQKSCVEAKELVKRIKTDFEDNMNNDLHVKTAFDSLYTTVSRLVELNKKQMLSAKESKEAIEQLTAIDYVFQALF
jgi:cysteinyl-tRNA synthetase